MSTKYHKMKVKKQAEVQLLYLFFFSHIVKENGLSKLMASMFICL